MAGEHAHKLFVMHAYQVPFEGRLGRGSSAAELRRHYEQQALVELRKLLGAWDKSGVALEPILRKCDPRSATLAEAGRRQIDLLALGTHARSGLARALVGSVAEALIRNARCDVLVSRPARFSFELP